MRCLVLLLCLAVGMAFSAPTQPQDPVVVALTAPTLDGACVMLPEEYQREQIAAFKKEVPDHKLSHFGRSVRRAAKQNPKHAMVSNPGNSSCLWSIYVDWLQSSGFRVMALKWDAPRDEMLKAIRGANAILWPGGVLSRPTEIYKNYLNRMCDIYDWVKAENDLGNQVALWGTCEGFQMMTVCAAGRNVSVLWGPYRGTSPKMLPNNWTKYQATSKMLGNAVGGIRGDGAPANVLDYAHTENTTLNWHHLGVPPHMFVTNPILNASGLAPLATTNDINGRTFVSILEDQGKLRNIYGVQFHPERVMFEWDNNLITHQVHAIEVSEYLGLFLVTRARMNNNTFGPSSVVEPMLINNIEPMNMGFGIRIYYI